MLSDALATQLSDDGGLDDEPRCWVCLCGPQAGSLSLPCKCPNLHSHPACLARWQLQQAGKQEERACRFCLAELPPWPQMLINGHKHAAISQHPDAESATQELPLVPITTIDVVFEQNMVRIPCFPGKEGAELFQRQVRHAFQLPESVRLDVTFELEAPALDPAQGETVWLNGFRYFEAAFQMANYAATRQGAAPQHARPALSRAHSAPELYDIALLATPGALVNSLAELSTASMQHPALSSQPPLANAPSTVHLNSEPQAPQQPPICAPHASPPRLHAFAGPSAAEEDAAEDRKSSGSCYGRMPSLKLTRWFSRTLLRSATAMRRWW